MIISNLKTLLAQQNLTISKTSIDTGISRPTLTALANNNFKGIQLDTLDTLCKYLNVTPNDILSFFPYEINFDFSTIDTNSFFVDIVYGSKSISFQCDYDFQTKLYSYSFSPKDLNYLSTDKFIELLTINLFVTDQVSTVSKRFFNSLPVQITNIVKQKIIEHCVSLIPNNNEIKPLLSDKTRIIFDLNLQ